MESAGGDTGIAWSLSLYDDEGIARAEHERVAALISFRRQRNSEPH